MKDVMLESQLRLSFVMIHGQLLEHKQKAKELIVQSIRTENTIMWVRIRSNSAAHGKT